MAVSEGLPVLVVGFNRASALIQVLTALQSQKVRKLYLWLDGPRVDYPKDTLEQAKIRAFLGETSFAFPTDFVFQNDNLGCRKSVSGAVSWFFSQEDCGAVIEDDCVPSHQCIDFMAEQLERWKSDESVLTVSGNSILRDWDKGVASYHFSKYPHVWGWASWRRVWEKYDPDIKEWGKLKRSNWLRDDVGLDADAERFWRHKFNQIERGVVDTWDYQLTFLSFLEGGKNIIPHQNLVENIGFGIGATHTRNRPPCLVEGFGDIGSVKHLSDSTVDEAMDRRLEQFVHRTKRGPIEILVIVWRTIIKRFWPRSRANS